MDNGNCAHHERQLESLADEFGVVCGDKIGLLNFPVPDRAEKVGGITRDSLPQEEILKNELTTLLQNPKRFFEEELLVGDVSNLVENQVAYYDVEALIIEG
jgi:hypothetical protein